MDGGTKGIYNGTNGWAIGNGPGAYSPEEEDKADAEALYRLLEEKIVRGTRRDRSHDATGQTRGSASTYIFHGAIHKLPLTSSLPV
jgi:glucan phosphorylase